MPDILGNIVTLNGINNLTLVDSAAKSKNEVVFEAAESDTRASDSETINLLPLVFADVIDFTEAIDLTVDEGADDVDETLQRAN